MDAAIVQADEVVADEATVVSDAVSKTDVIDFVETSAELSAKTYYVPIT